MDIGYQTVEYNANKTLDIIVPRLAEEYELELHKPKVSITNCGYMPFNSGMFIPTGEYGVIKLQKESCRFKMGGCSTVSHETGHAAVYQNCPTFEENYKENDILLFLEEGICQKFMKKGLKFLKDEDYISSLSFYYKMVKYLIVRKTVGVLFPDQYKVGEMLVDYYDRKGVSIKRLIISPEEFKEDLEKNWKNMIDPCSRLMVEFYERLLGK